MMKNALVSVIVPVYNAESYLYECVNSIIGQTYKNLEILLIDDGSKDKSGEICDIYSTKDSRIVVHHKENSGVSKTRNYGLDNCHGEWVAFVDADDRIGIDYIERLIDFTKDSDLYVGGYCTFGSSEKKTCPRKAYKIDLDNEINKVDVRPGTPEINVIYHICGKIYKNQIIQKYSIRFPSNIKLAEDCCFNLMYLSHCASIFMIPYAGYYYRRTNRATPYRFDLRMFYAHYRTIASQFTEIERVFDYKFKTLPNNLYSSFFMALKAKLFYDMSINDLMNESGYYKKNREFTFSELKFLSTFEKLFLSFVYRLPVLGYAFVIIYRNTRKR